jgi:RimJ/RimL family protein N-acetyltransferase
MGKKQLVKLAPLDHDNPDQVGWMYKVRAHPEVASYFFAPPPIKYLDHVQFLSNAHEKGERQFFIVYVGTEMSGYCQIIHRQDSLEIGFALHPQWWGQGIGGASMQALLDHIRHSQDLRSKAIILIVKKDNARAIHLYEKFGFTIINEHMGQITMKYKEKYA